MRILIWSEFFWPHIGGVEVLLGSLAEALRLRSHQVWVVTQHHDPDLPPEEEHRGVRLFRLPAEQAIGRRDLDGVIRIRRRASAILAEFRPNVVAVALPGQLVYFQLKSEAAHRAPLLVNVHGTYPDEFLRPDLAYGNRIRAARWVTACSSAALDETRRAIPEVASRSSVLYNGLPTPDVEVSPPPDEPRILYAGRLSQEKGVEVAIAAHSRVVRRRPRARLILVGDGPMRAVLERQAHQLGLARSVEFAGWIAPDDIPRAMTGSTVVVVPSHQEGFSLAALQAAQVGRPVVGTKVGGLPEVVSHGETGLLVERGDPLGLTSALIRLLDDPVLASRLGDAARRRALETFGWGSFVDGYERVCLRLAS